MSFNVVFTQRSWRVSEPSKSVIVGRYALAIEVGGSALRFQQNAAGTWPPANSKSEL
jgi:hypothetical protein